MRAIIVERRRGRLGQEMSWKAIDRYSQDYVELQSKDKVRFYKTPDAILKQPARAL